MSNKEDCALTPLTPADCDLRGLEWMPLYGGRLFGSDFDAHATDSEWRAALQLWWAAWNQVPAASLPDDDVALCRLAGYGRDLKAWRKVKERALYGFAICTDGRLYHRALAEFAKDSWERRLKDRERKAKYRARRESGDGTRTETGTGRGHDAAGTRSGTADEMRRDETGQDRTLNSEPKGSGWRPPARDVIFAELLPWLNKRAGKDCRSLVGKWLSEQRDDDAVRLTMEACEQENPVDPVAWIAARFKPRETWDQRRIREGLKAIGAA